MINLISKKIRDIVVGQNGYFRFDLYFFVAAITWISCVFSSCNNVHSNGDRFVGHWQTNSDCIIIVKAGDYYEVTRSRCNPDYKVIYISDQDDTGVDVCSFNNGCFVAVSSKKPIVCENASGGIVYSGQDYWRTSEPFRSDR